MKRRTCSMEVEYTSESVNFALDRLEGTYTTNCRSLEEAMRRAVQDIRASNRRPLEIVVDGYVTMTITKLPPDPVHWGFFGPYAAQAEHLWSKIYFG
jgi:hypothetical protein